jgi:hypothetical protein
MMFLLIITKEIQGKTENTVNDPTIVKPQYTLLFIAYGSLLIYNKKINLSHYPGATCKKKKTSGPQTNRQAQKAGWKRSL